MSLRSIPSIVLAFILYNAIVFISGTTEVLNHALFELPMLSGGVWRFEVGDLIILITLFLLFAELIKATWGILPLYSGPSIFTATEGLANLTPETYTGLDLFGLQPVENVGWEK